MSISDPSGRLARWSLLVQQYDFDIQHRPGVVHGNADALSRCPYASPSLTISAYEVPGVQIGCIRDLQRHDPDLADLIQYLESSKLPDKDSVARSLLLTIDDYFLSEDGLLFHLWTPKGRRRTTTHICDAQVCTMCKCFCGGVDANNPLEHIRCAECGRGFLNRLCYEMHKQPYCAAVDNRLTCNRIYACPKCHEDLKIVRGQRSNKNQWNGKPHECYKSYCNICKRNVNKYDHLCFLRPFKLEEVFEEQDEKRGLFVFMDMECLREESGWLVVNLIVVQDELGDEWVFKGLQALSEFCKSLFSEKGKLHRHTLGITKYVHVFTHNGSHFDYYPIITELGKYRRK